MPRPLAKSPPAKRIRRLPDDLRAEAIATARRLIVEGEDKVLTMRAVADAMGITYPNLSHHFGSAAGLYAAVAEALVFEFVSGLRAATATLQPTDRPGGKLVDAVFALYGEKGLGWVLAWIARNGEIDSLQTAGATLNAFIAERSLSAGDPDQRRLVEIALLVNYAAFAETAIGPLMGELLGMSADARRSAIAKAITNLH